MNKRKSFMLLAVGCSIILIIVLIWYYYQFTGVIRVPQHYPTIQKAIDAAKPGDTILVSSGTYTETIFIEKDDLVLIGEDRNTTIIDGYKGVEPVTSGPVIFISANGVRITGFTVRNSCRVCYGIYVHYSSNNSIYGNIISENNRGIHLYNCANVNVSNNIVANNTGVGIEIRYSRNVTLRDNEISGNKYNLGVWGFSLDQFIHDIDVSNRVNGKPVYYWINRANEIVPQDAGYVGAINCSNITIENMTFSNEGQGVSFAYTNSSTMKNINSLNNWEGISLYYSFNNVIHNNTVSFNMQGLYMSRSSYNDVSLNSISQNTEDGIFLHFAQNNTFYTNTIKNNGNGLYVYGSFHNIFSRNNLLFNRDQIGENFESENAWDDGYSGNYWSDYTGVDADGDGIGDTPYIIDDKNQDRYPLMKQHT